MQSRLTSRWHDVHERMRIATEMDKILREQSNPDRPAQIVQFWDYLDRRAALAKEGK